MARAFLRGLPAQAGQSIIEILVILSVTSILFSMVSSLSRAGVVEGQVRRQAERLVYDLRRVQDIAYLSQEYDGRVPCGYGIELKRNNYQLIVVDSISGDCQAPDSFEFSLAERLPDNTTSFEKPVRAEAASFEIIAFTPPEPNTYFFSSGSEEVPYVAPPNSDTNIFVLGAGGFEYALEVNRFGGVSLVGALH